MTLTIISGKVAAPRRIVLYGIHGVGKSSWAAKAPKPIFVPTEDGLGDIECDKFPVAKSFEDLMGALKSVYEEKHSYQTLVIDSLDWAEKLIHAQLCADKNIANIEDVGYAKGYVYALDYWRRLVDALDMIRSERGMTEILIAHSAIARFEDPTQESYDRYVPQLNKHAAALITQRADEILFAGYKVYSKTSDEGFGRKRTRAVGQGERVVFTTERPGHIAKNRLGLPDELALDWDAYAQHVTTTNGKKEKK